MSIILIYTLIIMLIVIGLENMISMNEHNSMDKFIKNDIDNSFFYLDTKLNTFLSDCSLSNLKLNDINNTFFEEKCFKIPETYKNNEIEIINESLGVYKICYKYDLNLLKNSAINKNKIIIEENSKSCVIKYYNDNIVNINLLKEFHNFYNNTISITPTNLNLVTDITFTKNSKTYNKQNYFNNGISLYETFTVDNIFVYISEYNDNVIYYYDFNTKELTLFVDNTNLDENTSNALKSIFKKIKNNYIIINGNVNETSFKIKIKE